MRGPGFPIFAQGDDSNVPRQPTLYQVQSTYVADAVQTATQQAMAIAAGLAIAVIWFLGRRK